MADFGTFMLAITIILIVLIPEDAGRLFAKAVKAYRKEIRK